MTAIFTLFGPKVLAGIGALVAALIALFAARKSFKNDGINEQKAKDADAYAKHLQDIARAGVARPTGSMSDDPYNRDRTQ